MVRWCGAALVVPLMLHDDLLGIVVLNVLGPSGLGLLRPGTVPTGVQVFAWIGTIARGRPRWNRAVTSSLPRRCTASAASVSRGSPATCSARCAGGPGCGQTLVQRVALGGRHVGVPGCGPRQILAGFPGTKSGEGLVVLVQDVPAIRGAGLVAVDAIAVQPAVADDLRLDHRQAGGGHRLEEFELCVHLPN